MNHILEQLDQILEQRKTETADTSYVASLYAKGTEKILKKIGEESTETIMAAKDLECHHTQDTEDHLVYEVTDLWFHTLVLLSHKGLSSQAVLQELNRRFGLSGLEEKASRTH